MRARLNLAEVTKQVASCHCADFLTRPHKVRSVIEFHNVHKTYRVAGKEIPALHPTNLRVDDGQVFGIIGHSGAGKSTLLRLINRLETPSGGQIVVDGEDVTAL
ncbi:DL-methionine transporter ATP-binding subunit, partial [Pseudomonas syringae pv. actinidiae ICMP 19079]